MDHSGSVVVLPITDVRPWWIRAFILIAISTPIFSHIVLHSTIHAEHYVDDLLKTVAYACFVWLFVGLCAGLRQLLDWLAVGVIPAITLLLTGALFRSRSIWSLIHKAVPAASANPLQGELDLVFKLLIIMIATPLALLIVGSFPATNLMRWISRKGATRTAHAALVGAIFLRMFQHVSEVVERSMDAWREENPDVYLPRHRGDWAGSIWSKAHLVSWFHASVTAWCKFITIQTLAAVPNIVRDFGRALPEVSTRDEVNRANSHIN